MGAAGPSHRHAFAKAHAGRTMGPSRCCRLQRVAGASSSFCSSSNLSARPGSRRCGKQGRDATRTLGLRRVWRRLSRQRFCIVYCAERQCRVLLRHSAFAFDHPSSESYQAASERLLRASRSAARSSSAARFSATRRRTAASVAQQQQLLQQAQRPGHERARSRTWQK